MEDDLYNSIEDYYNTGIDYLEKGEFEKGKTFLKKVISYPNLNNNYFYISKAWDKIGVLHYKNGDFKNAISCFSNAIKLYVNIKYYENRANCYLMDNDFLKAYDEFEYILNNFSTYSEIKKEFYLNIQGDILDELKKPNKAIEKYNLALVINPNNFKIRYNRGRVYSDIGEHEKARSDYKYILENATETKDTINLIQCSQYNLAISYFETCCDGINSIKGFTKEKFLEVKKYLKEKVDDMDYIYDNNNENNSPQKTNSKIKLGKRRRGRSYILKAGSENAECVEEEDLLIMHPKKKRRICSIM